jgi:hypothetical protein
MATKDEKLRTRAKLESCRGNKAKPVNLRIHKSTLNTYLNWGADHSSNGSNESLGYMVPV